MQISSVSIKNFRTIKYSEIEFFKLSALIGGNNAGKSTVLEALQFFFEASPKINASDFHKYQTLDDIVISVTFCNFTSNELELFSNAIDENVMTVVRQFSFTDSTAPNYSVSAKVFKEFNSFREVVSASDKLKEYRAVQDKYDLPRVRSSADAEQSIIDWEKTHKDVLTKEIVKGFFGATNVANGKLKKKTSLRFIPAVRDVSQDAQHSKSSPVLGLLSDITKQALENKTELKEFLERTIQEASDLVDPKKIPGLQNVSAEISGLLKQYYKDSSVVAEWEDVEPISINFPKPKIMVNDDGIQTDISRVGHGLQRAILFSIVQFLAQDYNSGEPSDDFTDSQSDVILLVEEPEIYQHPIKQLVLYDNFKKLVEGFNKNNGIRIQIIFATHSEKFISMPDFEICQILRKKKNANDEVVHSSNSLMMNDCSIELASFLEPPVEPMNADAFVTKLHIFNREINEGFFADKVILVEGETDKPVLEAYYEMLGRNPLYEGIQVIVVGGKSKLILPTYIFSRLNIPTFVLFDNDDRKSKKNRKSGIRDNRLIQKIMRAENIADMPVGLGTNFFAFDGNLEKTLINVLGQKEYDLNFERVSKRFGLKASDIKKSPASFYMLMKTCGMHVDDFKELQEITNAVDGM